jgi:hypothetical protein
MSRFKANLDDGSHELWDDYRIRGNFVEAIRRDSHERVTFPSNKLKNIESYRVGQPGLSYRENNRSDDSRVVDD